MIADKSFGGAPSTQGFVGALSIAFLTALGLAVYNIRMKQIEQHRAWMIRAWVWAGSIITLRIMYVSCPLWFAFIRLPGEGKGFEDTVDMRQK